MSWAVDGCGPMHRARSTRTSFPDISAPSCSSSLATQPNARCAVTHIALGTLSPSSPPSPEQGGLSETPALITSSLRLSRSGLPDQPALPLSTVARSGGARTLGRQPDFGGAFCLRELHATLFERSRERGPSLASKKPERAKHGCRTESFFCADV